MGRALQDLLGITEPIVLGPFGGASSIELTALVSEAGGLGSYGLYGYTPDRIRETIASLRAATARPFAVNLWLPTGDEVAPADLDLRPYLEALAPLYEEVGVEAPTPRPRSSRHSRPSSKRFWMPHPLWSASSTAFPRRTFSTAPTVAASMSLRQRRP